MTLAFENDLRALAAHLRARRASILHGWTEDVLGDTESPAQSLSRVQFEDHIPQLLETFEELLLAGTREAGEEVQQAQAARAEEHGLQRWQQGYNQSQTMREFGHLHVRLLNELDAFEDQHPSVSRVILRLARRTLIRVCSEATCVSAGSFARWRQTEAATRAQELERALEQVRALERVRAALWREAAHDVRGTVGIISNASALWQREPRVHEPTTVHEHPSEMLQRAVASLQALLSDIIELARLEAGQEIRRVEPFDAAALLRQFCEVRRPLAIERALFLKTEGPTTLAVEGDPVKLQRIAQNLLFNAFAATTQGGVEVRWAVAGAESNGQWMLEVCDTGPGLIGAAQPLEQVLQRATEESTALDATRGAWERNDTVNLHPLQGLPSGNERAPRTLGGEGIGLAIVKRLCELLEATLEFHTAAHEGATFRVIFPRRYASETLDRGVL